MRLFLKTLQCNSTWSQGGVDMSHCPSSAMRQPSSMRRKIPIWVPDPVINWGHGFRGFSLDTCEIMNAVRMDISLGKRPFFPIRSPSRPNSAAFDTSSSIGLVTNATPEASEKIFSFHSTPIPEASSALRNLTNNIQEKEVLAQKRLLPSFKSPHSASVGVREKEEQRVVQSGSPYKKQMLELRQEVARLTSFIQEHRPSWRRTRSPSLPASPLLCSVLLGLLSAMLFVYLGHSYFNLFGLLSDEYNWERYL